MVKQGSIILIDFNPQAGHEQKGRRPALVISNDLYNKYSEMAIVCPITNTDKSHPFHVRLDDKTKTSGVILCDQVKTMGIKIRIFKHLENIPEDILENVLDIVFSLIEK
jgi:mRNA interferase MazF